jgi:hypothetical protein
MDPSRIRSVAWQTAIMVGLAGQVFTGCDHTPWTKYGQLEVDLPTDRVALVGKPSEGGRRVVEQPHWGARVFDVFDVGGRRSDYVCADGGRLKNWSQFKAVPVPGRQVVLEERYQPAYPDGNPWPEFRLSTEDGESPNRLASTPPGFTVAFTHVLYVFDAPALLWASYGPKGQLFQMGTTDGSISSYYNTAMFGVDNPFAAYRLPEHFDGVTGAPPLGGAFDRGLAAVSSGLFPASRLVGCYVANRSLSLDLLELRSYDAAGRRLAREYFQYQPRPYDQKIASVYTKSFAKRF